MLSIEHCRKRLEKYGKKYTDDQIREIRDALYLFAKCQIKDMKEQDGRKCSDLNKSNSPQKSS